MLASTLGLVACSEKDQTYYFNHIDEAEKKIAQCEKELNAAFEKSDETKMEAIFAKESECFVAREALKEYRDIQRENKRREEEIRKKVELEKIKTDIQNQYGSQSWQEFSHTFVNSECSKMMFADDKCELMKEFYKEKITPAIAEMRGNGLEALLEEKQTYCKQDQRLYSTCDVWTTAVKEQAKEDFEKLAFNDLAKLKDKYCANSSFANPEPCGTYRTVFNEKEEVFIKLLTQKYDSLKVIYNLCIDQIKLENNWEKKHRIKLDVPCSQAKAARSELHLPYDDFETKMD
ncbi:hypothetical protein F9B74_03495 [Pelistega sp. NLN82]|uniref:Uncharacterized protein n=2 Tax=Pelistega ratti TaxID=2652177 RepID=A0A6L9Y4J1_9BURK|nr:hypothetical protein [Pelistega ratti]